MRSTLKKVFLNSGNKANSKRQRGHFGKLNRGFFCMQFLCFSREPRDIYYHCICGLWLSTCGFLGKPISVELLLIEKCKEKKTRICALNGGSCSCYPMLCALRVLGVLGVDVTLQNISIFIPTSLEKSHHSTFALGFSLIIFCSFRVPSFLARSSKFFPISIKKEFCNPLLIWPCIQTSCSGFKIRLMDCVTLSVISYLPNDCLARIFRRWNSHIEFSSPYYCILSLRRCHI